MTPAPLLLLAGALALSGCRAHVSHCGDPMSTARDVPGLGEGRVIDVTEISGLELLLVPGEPYATGALCEVDGGRLLTGAEAFTAARGRTADPSALAALSMLLLERGVAGMSPWSDPALHGGRSPAAPSPQPPHLDGDTLEYWRPHEQAANFVRVRLNLSTLEVESALLDTQVVKLDRDPIELAREGLALPNFLDRRAALVSAASLDDPRVEALLIEASANSAWLVRQEAARQLGERAGRGEALSAEAQAALERLAAEDEKDEVKAAAAQALRRSATAP